MTDKIIRGAFFGLFGSPKPPKPFKAPDTLNSKQFASIQDLISEGEIEGFATPSKANITDRFSSAYINASLKDVFLNNTPVLNKNASNTSPQSTDFNFQDVGFAARFGTSNQLHIPGIEGSQSSSNVGVKVEKSSPRVRTITNTAVDAVRITITVPQLQRFTDKGDIFGTSISLRISIKYNGDSSFTNLITDTITGRTADAYQKDYRVTFDRERINLGTAFPLDLRVERLTDDNASDTLKNEFNWTTLTEIVDDKLSYPNSAYTNLRIDSEQFSSIPDRAYRIRGVKVRIPGAGSNNSGTPTVDLQTGRVIYPNGYIFGGTMGAAQWCSCPSLILLDLLTNKRYGFGTQLDADNSFTQNGTSNTLDLFSFISASKYANELVDDGDGGQEARFSCNVNIQGSNEAFKLINELAGVMRCFPIWSEGTVNISQDRPIDSSYLFSLSNVGEEGFNYSGSSLKQRNTVINVSYFNMDSREIDYEVVEDTAAIAKLGILKKDIKAFATTSRGQAQRLGKAILFSQQQETEVCTFTTSIESGAIVRPGSVITVNDPVRGGERRSGRVKSATTTTITVDNDLNLNTFGGANQKCSVILPDGSVETKDVIGVVSGVITLDSALSQLPNVNTIWLLESDTLKAQTFRVISVTEKDQINYEITAVTYIAEKYANIEQGISLPTRNISLLNELKNPPQNLQAEEKIVIINNLAVPKLLISWKFINGVSQYLVQYRFNSSNWVSEVVFKPDFEIFNTEAGTYEIRVFSYNSGLKLSATSSDITFIAKGKTEPPENVQNLSIEPVTNKLVRLRWSESISPDVIHGGKVYVRHSNKTDGTGTFQNSIDLIEALAGNTTEAVVPSLEGEYILKFRDDQGNFSTGETSIIQDLPDLIDSQQILADREDTDTTPFGGNKDKCSVVSGALTLTDPATDLEGTYDFATTLDLGSVFSLNLKRLVQSIGFALGGQTITATYERKTATVNSQSVTVIEITSNSHGRSSGDYINFVSLTGGASNGVFQIISDNITSNSFQFLASGNAISSSNCTFAFVNTIDQLIPSGTFWDDYAPNGNFDGPAVNDVTAALQVRTTQTDPSASPTYTQFNTFANGTFKGRGFQFRLVLKSENIGHNISIQQLGILAAFESRTERSYVSGSGTSTVALSSGTNANGLDVTFAKPFFVGTSNLGGANAFPPSIGITIQNAAQGEYFVIKTDTNGNYLNAAGSIINGQGFNIKILNSSNNPVNKKFTFQAVGYGKGV